MDARRLLDEMYAANIRRNREKDGTLAYFFNLPTPGIDPMPPRVGELSPEELKRIRAEKREQSGVRQKWSGPAEDMIIRVLKGVFNVKNIHRQADRLQEVQGSGKKFFANANKPDMSFAACDVDGSWKDGYCEVKCTSPNATSIDLHTGSFHQQFKFMEKHSDCICWWGLVFWEERGKARVFIIPHAYMKQLREEILPERAEKRYNGRSIRRKDFDLLEDCEIVKAGNRWALCPGHWYAKGAQLW